MSNEELKELINESVREVLKEERLTLYEIMIPNISSQEMAKIQKKFGSPDAYNKEGFIDMADWVYDEN
jgi:hypothetical protein